MYHRRPKTWDTLVTPNTFDTWVWFWGVNDVWSGASSYSVSIIGTRASLSAIPRLAINGPLDVVKFIRRFNEPPCAENCLMQ